MGICQKVVCRISRANNATRPCSPALPEPKTLACDPCIAGASTAALDLSASFPTASYEYMASIVNNITVRNPDCTGMWRAIPMACLPHPTTVPCPCAFNPNKTNSGRGSNIFDYRHRRISDDINFRHWACRIYDASNCEQRSRKDWQRKFK